MPTSPKIVIVGGGVGAVEAALAVRHLAGDVPAIELVAPETAFVYRALSVAEPFGYARHLEVPLSRLRRSHGISHRRDVLVAVHPRTREIELGDGTLHHYDALVLALGARPEGWLQGAVTFTGPAAVPAVRDVLARIERGEVGSVAFATPTDGWTLPAYELALLTATWCAERHLGDVEISVVAPEPAPVAVFGPAASDAVRGLLADRGIRFQSGGAPAADAVVALPRLRRTPIPGVPADVEGFVPVDDHAAVPGLRDVYAVGDVTDQPVKQGGLATQQADAAAAMIAHRLGAAVQQAAFRPALRGLLLTGVTSAYLRSDGDVSTASFDALWWPPTKVAGRYLGPWLSSHAHTDTLVDRPAPADPDRTARDRAEVRAMAASLARAEARWGDHDSALRWIEAVERLDGVLDHELATLRQACRAEITVAAPRP